MEHPASHTGHSSMQPAADLKTWSITTPRLEHSADMAAETPSIIDPFDIASSPPRRA